MVKITSNIRSAVFMLVMVLVLVLAGGLFTWFDRGRVADPLKLGVLPQQNQAVTRDYYMPLVDYLNATLTTTVTLSVPESYDQLLQWFEDQQIDLAFLGGVTFVKAHIANGAVPLVMRDGDNRYQSVAIVRADNPATSLDALQGQSLAFGSSLSTSGHFMPRYFFGEMGMMPERFFSGVSYTGAHDATAEWVRDGKSDVGVMSAGVLYRMYVDGQIMPGEVKVIWESPPYADYVWAIQPTIKKSQQREISEAFLTMNTNPDNKALLIGLGANFYIPAQVDDFDILQNIVTGIEATLPP